MRDIDIETIYEYFEAKQDRANKYWEMYQYYKCTGTVKLFQYRRLNYSYLLNVYLASARNRLSAKLLEFMETVIINGVLHLDVCSSLAGRTMSGPSDVWQEYIDYDEFKEVEDGWEDEFNEWTWGFLFTPEKETCSYSDYATKPTVELLLQSMEAETLEEKFMYLDQIIHLSHQTGDLSYLYVEGGRKTLNRLDNAFGH